VIMSNRTVRIILGTMAIGGDASDQVSTQMIKLFAKQGFPELDSAIMYCGGKTEKTLGRILEKEKLEYSIATKANPWFDGTSSKTTPQGGLRPEYLRKQMEISLRNLRVNSIDIFYLHAPDHDTPLEDTLRGVNDLFVEGKFKHFGLSNFSAWQVVQIYYLCKANGYVLPTVYQGMYNCITRNVEDELFPALRSCGIRFYCYNPLAGGILTGRYKFEDNPEGGRFSSKTVWGQRYRERFWTKAQFDALEILQKVCEENGCTATEASLRWLMHHSQLSGEREDGLILGGSTFSHMEENLKSALRGPLPETVVAALEEAWQCSKASCPRYFR